MACRSVAAGCHVDFARVGPGIRDELGNRLRRERWVYHHNEGDRVDAGDGCDVAEEVEIEFLVKRRIDRGRGADQEEVYPSGGAFTTRSVPILLPGPGLFSMTNCWPRRSDSHWPIRRALMSVDPPAANGTTMRTGCDG